MPKLVDTQTPQILAGYIDQYGDRWITYGTVERSVTFSLVEMVNMPSAIFKKVAKVGLAVLRSSSREAFFKQIEMFDRFSSCVVLRQPGWDCSMFLYGDTSVWKCRGDSRKAVVSADSLSRFGQSGFLPDWRHRVGAIVQHQPLPRFVMAFALVGPLLRFFPADAQSPIVEIVGPHETGKSTLAKAAGSVWGGDGEGVGFGESWDFSPAEFDKLASEYRDTLLILNEAELSGTKRKIRAEAVRGAIFKTTDSGSRRRFQDPLRFDRARVAVLSTTNTPLRDLVGGDSTSKRAVLSRVLTIDADRSYGIFDTVPSGFSNAREAAETLDRETDAFFGSAGRWFIGCLLEQLRANGGDNFSRDVQYRYQRYLAEPAIACLPTARQAKTAAMTCVADDAAIAFGVFSSDWGSILASIAALAPPQNKPRHQISALEQIRSYVVSVGCTFLRADHLNRPLSQHEFNRLNGVWLDGSSFLVPTGTFRAQMPNHLELLRKLKASGVLQPERGLYSKLSKKVPAAICVDQGRRAYFFRLPP